MDERLKKYLNKVNVYLKSVPMSERADIISEIKSHMEELQYKNSLGPEEIIVQLGTEKDLAQAYLGEIICESNPVQFRRFLMVFSFYCLTGLTGLFVIPIFSVLAVGLKVSSVIAVIAGFIKTIAYFVGIDIPFIMFQFGSYSLHPIFVFPASAAIGALLYIGGAVSWKLVMKYIKSVSVHKKVLIKD